MLDRKDKALLSQAAVYVVLGLVAAVGLLVVALVLGEVVHIFRLAAGV